MALSYKNIVITPNTGQNSDPTIAFQGANANVNSAVTMYVYPDSNGTLSFEGTAGQLFSITNDLTGSVFSVNDVSGLPLIEANVTSQQITLGQFYGNVGIGTTSAVYKLDVAGGANISFPTLIVGGQNVMSSFVKLSSPSTQTITSDLVISGNLTFLGNASTISSNNLVVGDSMIYLAANNYSGTDILDIGFVANYANGTGANVHTGLFRSGGTKEYYLFQGYDKEPLGNYIDPTGNNITMAVLNSTIRTSNLILGGANTINWITSGYVVANASFGKANNALANTSGVSFAGDLYIPGNVGIGTTSPSEKLHLYDGSVDPYLLVDGSAGSRDCGIKIKAGATAVTALRGDVSGAMFLNAGGSSALYLNNSGTGGIIIGGGGGYTTMYQSARAPIFYDSDNTGYYVDPAGTSNFSGLNIGGNAAVTAGNITTYALPRRGLVVNQGNDSTTYYYKIGLIDQNNGSFHVRGNIGGHDGPQGGTQGAASVDLSIFSRYGNIPVQGFVRGNIGNQDLQVYKDSANNVHIYVKTTVYALVDIMYSEAPGGTTYFNPSASTTTPASLGYTLVWQASSNQGTTTTGIQTAANRALTKASMPAGSVLQVVSAVKKDTSTCNSTTFVDVSGLSLSITPTSSTSKILVIASVALGALNEGALRLLRDGILIDGSTATTAPSTNFTVSVDDGLTYATMTGTSTIYDSPGTTSPVTYKVQFASMYATGRYCYVNRYPSAWETTYGAGTTSTIIAMEIAQ